jgi:putative phosphoribosyl transferase
VLVRAAGVTLKGELSIPDHATGIVVFAHGSGSGRYSPRNQQIARYLVRAGFAALLFDLLTVAEEVLERYSSHVRNDIQLLADRLYGVVDWIKSQRAIARLPIGLLGSNSGAAAAAVAATRLPIGALVARGSGVELAGDALDELRCPTLLVVGGEDPVSLERGHYVLERLSAPAKLHVVEGATPLFDQPSALDEVARVATAWFEEYLLEHQDEIRIS